MNASNVQAVVLCRINPPSDHHIRSLLKQPCNHCDLIYRFSKIQRRKGRKSAQNVSCTALFHSEKVNSSPLRCVAAFKVNKKSQSLDQYVSSAQ